MIFYDMEVFRHDWLGVFWDMEARREEVIINDLSTLQHFHETHRDMIWAGFNVKHYDQYIIKGLLCGFDPKEVSDWIIERGRQGWEFSQAFNSIQLVSYDVAAGVKIGVGLKDIEGFLGADIRESDVSFDIDRPLTKREINRTVKYCRHDVKYAYETFMHTPQTFITMQQVIKSFPSMVTMKDIGDTKTRITAKVLGCLRQNFNDEFKYKTFDCIKLDKYQNVKEWFLSKRDEEKPSDSEELKSWYTKNKLQIDVAGVPHVFGFGGVHGAPSKPVHRRGRILHVDVNNFYPSLLLAYDLITRAASNSNYTRIYYTRKQLKSQQLEAAECSDWERVKEYKQAQEPYKLMLNALTGAMKDKTCTAYDPRNNNIMCINGQLMLLDLIEHLEAVRGFELIQSNTDGLIVMIPDETQLFEQVKSICHDWERRCSTEKCEIKLEIDEIREIYQKDVNNYLWIDANGRTERKGAWLKSLSELEQDLAIINEALVEYMVNGVPIEQTIRGCCDLVKFQKIIKRSNKYDWIEHNERQYYNKAFRVFASRDPYDSPLMKHSKSRGKLEKVGNTPSRCFLMNESVVDVPIPDKLDKEWYISEARKRLLQFKENDYEQLQIV